MLCAKQKKPSNVGFLDEEFGRSDEDFFESTTDDSIHAYRNRVTFAYILQIMCLIIFVVTAVFVPVLHDVFTYIYKNPYHVYTAAIVVESMIFLSAIIFVDKIAKSTFLRVSMFVALNVLELFNASLAIIAYLDGSTYERSYMILIPLVGTAIAVALTLIISPKIGVHYVERPYKTVFSAGIVVLVIFNVAIVSVCHDVKSDSQFETKGCTVGNYVNSSIGFIVMMFFILSEFVTIQFYNDFTLSLSSYFEMEKPSYQVAQNLYIGTLFMFIYILNLL